MNYMLTSKYVKKYEDVQFAFRYVFSYSYSYIMSNQLKKGEDMKCI